MGLNTEITHLHANKIDRQATDLSGSVQALANLGQPLIVAGCTRGAVGLPIDLVIDPCELVGNHVIVEADDWTGPPPLTLTAVGVRPGIPREEAQTVNILRCVQRFGRNPKRRDVIKNLH